MWTSSGRGPKLGCGAGVSFAVPTICDGRLPDRSQGLKKRLGEGRDSACDNTIEKASMRGMGISRSGWFVKRKGGGGATSGGTGHDRQVGVGGCLIHFRSLFRRITQASPIKPFGASKKPLLGCCWTLQGWSWTKSYATRLKSVSLERPRARRLPSQMASLGRGPWRPL